MTKKTRSLQPSPALVISCLALFVSFAGTAFAAGVVGKNSVHSAQIANGAVHRIDLKNGAVGSAKIAAGAVGSGQLAVNSVGSPQLAANSVGSTQIADNGVASPEVAQDSLAAKDLAPGSVGSSEVADQSIAAKDLAHNSVTPTELRSGAVGSGELAQISVQPTIESHDVAAGATESSTVSCAAGQVSVSGGAESAPTSTGIAIVDSARVGDFGWKIRVHNYGAATGSVAPIVYCLTVAK